MKFWKKKICEYLGHTWHYNFPSIPNKRICSSCKKREKLDLHSLEWNQTFDDKRTNEELINKWFN